MMNNSNPKVSIIIPLYNQERYLSKCIMSLLKQTYTNIEIIIVNDGSTDGSPLIAHELASKDFRIKLINKVNEGTSFARRDGYLASNGDFIAFMDNDDIMPPDAIEIMVNEMLKNDVDVVWGTVVKKMGFLIKNNKKSKRPNENEFPTEQVVSQPTLYSDFYIGFFGISCIPVNIWGRLYRKSIIDKAYKETELFSSKMPCMAGDEYFNLKVFPFLRSAYKTEKVVYCYRCGGTVDHYNRFFPEVFYLSEERLRILDNSNYEKAYKWLFIEYVNCFYYHAGQLLQYCKTDKDSLFDFFKQELSNREKFVNRMADYFADHHIEKDGASFIIEKDLEGMYHHALLLQKRHFGTLKSRIKRFALKVIEHVNY